MVGVDTRPTFEGGGCHGETSKARHLAGGRRTGRIPRRESELIGGESTGLRLIGSGPLSCWEGWEGWLTSPYTSGGWDNEERIGLLGYLVPRPRSLLEVSGALQFELDSPAARGKKRENGGEKTRGERGAIHLQN